MDTIKSILKYIFYYTLNFAKICLQGWLSIGRDIAGIFVKFLLGLTIYQYFFIISCIGASGAGILPWIFYRIDFLGREEIFVGSNFKMIFVLPALAGIVMLLIPTAKKRKLFYIIYAAIAIPYIIGLFFPNPIHTKMINARDYTILPVMYVYGVFLLLVGLSAYRAFEKNVIEYSWLFAPLPYKGEYSNYIDSKYEFKRIHPPENQHGVSDRKLKIGSSIFNKLKNIVYKESDLRNKIKDESSSSISTKKASKKNLNIKIAR